MDYLSAVQEAYGSDVQEAVSEASSNNVELRLKEVRYVVLVLVSGHLREHQIFYAVVLTDDTILPQQ